jgi:nicotinamidase-related amidase
MINLKDSVLVVIDVQQRFVNIVDQHEALCKTIEKMIKIAEIFKLPMIYTEQVPEKLGGTVASIHNLLFPMVKPIAKKTFSAWGCEEFIQALKATNCKQVILVGIETHVCMYQTAHDLKKHGFEVFVLADATSSRATINKEMTLVRLRQEGIVVTVCESVICELLKGADNPYFRDVMAHFKK